MERKAVSEQVSQRLKDQFAPIYLTLTSITQGVVLSFLASQCEATYAHLDGADWLLITATFVLVLSVWQEYVMQVLAFVWIPTLLDALVPFAFLACELFLVHFVFHDQRTWLLMFSLLCLVGALAWLVTTAQVRVFVEENRDVVVMLASQSRYRTLFLGVIMLLSLCLWAFYTVLHLDQRRLIVAVIVLIFVGVFVLITIPYWNQVLTYVYGERRGNQRRNGRDTQRQKERHTAESMP